MGPVVIELSFQIARFRKDVCPATEQIATRDSDVPVGSLIDRAAVTIALEGQLVGFARIPIHPKSALSHLPGILAVSAIWKRRVIAIKIFCVNPVVGVRAELTAISHAAKRPLFRPAAAIKQEALRV